MMQYFIRKDDKRFKKYDFKNKNLLVGLCQYKHLPIPI